MTKQRLERALEVAMARVEATINLGGLSPQGFDKFVAEIDAILHPVEVIEEEVVRYVVIDANGVERWYSHDAKPGILEGERIVEMRGTIRREKKVVERSAVATGVKLDRGDKGTSIWPHGACIQGDVEDWGDLYGKIVNVTFEWTE